MVLGESYLQMDLTMHIGVWTQHKSSPAQRQGDGAVVTPLQSVTGPLEQQNVPGISW